ncbi:MAG: hypothetical protein FI717_08650 [SAR202 cluster bacterium]|nr:hypothetical protein [Chloroflexota bacterium]MQG34360.1 hypothetical protein [SAR202 cluster bacterium]HCP24607.1 hypothetical protein [Dehalococcoidia bacterium]
MKGLGFLLVPILLLVLGCGELTLTGTPPPDLAATVQALIAENQSATQPAPEATEAPDTEATITARVQSTVQALLNATAVPSPTPTQSSSPFITVSTPTKSGSRLPTPTGIPLPTPSATPFPTLAVACRLAADGTEVSAWVNGSQAATTTVASGEYTLFVTQGSGSSFSGQTITFKIGSTDAKQSVTWVQGGATEMDLTTVSGGLGRSFPGQNDRPSSGGVLAQPVPPHVVLGTASVGDC